MTQLGLATLLLMITVSVPITASAADKTTDFDECWKATFDEQLSGVVREKNTSGGPYGYIYSYDGDFKWIGEPKATPISSQYVYCFRKRIDDGGALILNGKAIELRQVGSLKLPIGTHDSAGYSYASARDPKDFPTLYGTFQMPEKPDTRLEIQLDRLRRTTTVVASTKIGKDRTVSYMKGDAAKLAP